MRFVAVAPHSRKSFYATLWDTIKKLPPDIRNDSIPGASIIMTQAC
ncbi:hypothetical protein WSK_1999 [Novosphingobium sp. Rr 2-17]|nr:hypothetical protein WSK_1999 [Novosphingobium sp. Rr 2-17]